MNYGRRGANRRRKSLSSTWKKLGKMFSVNFFMALIILFITLCVIGVCMGVGMFKGILSSAPDISTLDVRPSGYSSTVYDCKGNQITKLVAENSNRVYQTIDKIPEDLQHAFVAIEDERFYEHNGIDIKGIVRAGYIAVTSKDFSQGASTITQQLLKNNVFTNWTGESSLADKFIRKIQEQYLAVELEKVMEKDTILEYYMNTINLGQNTLGVQAASQRYFGKNVSDLNLSEAAVIASITQNPARWNPITHPDNNAQRRKVVLQYMLNQGYITDEEYEEAINDDVYSRIKTHNEENESSTIYSYFVDEVTSQVMNDLVEKKGYTDTQAYNMLYAGGLSIYTTQDPHIQGICDKVTSDPETYPANTRWYLEYQLSIEHSNGEVENISTELFESYFKKQDAGFSMLFSEQEKADEYINRFKEEYLKDSDNIIGEHKSLTPQPQISVTVMDQSNGYVKAIVGGRGKKEASLTLNRATNTKRQPGSTFKVVSTYAPALDAAGKTLADVEVDAPYSYSNGRPVSNWYSSGYKGVCTLRYGIEQSLNIVTVKLLTDITPQLGFDYLQNFGFTTLVDRQTRSDGTVVSDITQALALGGITYGVKNIELNAAYACIANNGQYIKPVYYTKIVDHDGNTIMECDPDTRQVLKPTTAYLLTDAMVDVVQKGTGGAVRFDNMSIAGKTGTTSDYNDVWFAGYTPYYTCTTWAGFDNNTKLSSSEEKALAKTIWKKCMQQIHEGLENKEFKQPPGIVKETICRQSGKRAVPGLCTLAGTCVTEIFDEESIPEGSCTSHVIGNVCALTGLRASATCPYITQGVIAISPEGDGHSGGTGWCPHSFDESGNLLYHGDPSLLNLTPAAPAEGAADAAATPYAPQTTPP
ncbi:MAG: PBP1A family penicillin-binding protein [Lachnospiraceae bacterium]|nr:PBP1A family penicillin-binding protein [Lachnospiraceae bacterium]